MFTLLSQSCKDYNAAVNVETSNPHHLHCIGVSLVALSTRRDPNPKSAVASLMACLRLVSDVQVHLVIPRDTKFGMSFGGRQIAVV